MKEFAKFTQFKNQDIDLQKMEAQYRQKMNDAGQRVEDLKAQLQATIADEFRSGKDATTAKNKLKDDISSAEKDFALAKAEYEECLRYTTEKRQSSGVTAEDVLRSYRDEFVPSVWEGEVKPILDRMAQARAEYLNSLMDLREKEREYAPLRTQMYDLSRTTKVDGAYVAVMNPVDYRQSEIPYISGQDLALIERNELPSGVERRKTGE
ncbi:hypothetical protein CVV65_07550 [Kyrpidia spormannii]|uniref:Uncharacterized protein n=1 Tax=Kyrpidia spormannii TaxID=2055160 RepID=A0A2K8N6T5_9BACL|nr:hypothetical protein [Kyrpidia spormannii]ATY84795.1 hypothetical protein CVV65_07550 [Kyrpidia spormannii]